MVELICPDCEWTINDDVSDRRCSLCGQSMVYDDRC
jgi:hypothetical protein